MAGGAVVAIVALALALGTGGDDAPAPPTTTSTTVDLASVTNEELEQVVNEHPEVVAMRLRLIERYIEAQDFEAANVHAEEAVVRATTLTERSLALTWLGLTTAILGDPEGGEGLLVQSLALDPTNRESLYYLARVRFEFLEQPDGAIAPLEELLAMGITDDQRSLFEEMLAQVRVAAGVATTTTTPTP
jgi:cytochrome c-type biogenesis protein CcmH/NrfG